MGQVLSGSHGSWVTRSDPSPTLLYRCIRALMFNYWVIRRIFLLHEERRHFEGVYKCKAIQFWACEVFLAAWMFRLNINIVFVFRSQYK